MSFINGEVLKISQESGPEIPLVVFGDEFYVRHETLDGYTVKYDQMKGLYCYAVLAEGNLLSSGIPVGKKTPWGIKKHQMEKAGIRDQKFYKRYRALKAEESSGDEPGIFRTYGINKGLLGGRRVSEGNVRGLTILVEFQDVSTQITADDVQAMLNADQYARNGNACSVKKYFQTMSTGKLTYQNDVVGPIRLDHRRNYYHNNLLVGETLEKAINQYNINLADFDSRGAGYADAINFLYAGQTQAISGSALWPHNSTYHAVYQGIRTHFYMLTSLGRSPVDLSIGTFCHENGHMLCRFPDLYDYGRRDNDNVESHGMGPYCLMSFGNQLNRRRSPAPVCAYLRNLVGWCDQANMLNNEGMFNLPHGDYNTVNLFETDKPNEYFIVENRSKIGHDSHLKSSGLAVYHCDILGSNEWQGATAEKHYQCALIQADGRMDLENNRGRYLTDFTGDLYGETAGVALAGTTNPSSQEWDGSDSGLIISDISEPGEIISFRVGENRSVFVKENQDDLLIPDNNLNGVVSTILVDVSGVIQGISVAVDITHTYIGDLRLELVSPSGQRVDLRDRQGGGTDDLRERYTSDDVLTALLGTELRGEWQLKVSDHAGQDIGRLNTWSLEIAYQTSQRTISKTASPNTVIPDDDASGITSSIMISETGTVKDVEVEVVIEHTYIGDLRLELLAPSGQKTLLQNALGSSKQNLHKTFHLANTTSLLEMIGQNVEGDWCLKVSDLAGLDEGMLKSWSIKIIM